MTIPIIGEKPRSGGLSVVPGGPLPPGMRVTFEIYLISDKADIATAVKLKHCRNLPEDGFLRLGLEDVLNMAATAGLTLREMADDWRYMTDAEILEHNSPKDDDAGETE